MHYVVISFDPRTDLSQSGVYDALNTVVGVCCRGRNVLVWLLWCGGLRFAVSFCGCDCVGARVGNISVT